MDRAWWVRLLDYAVPAITAFLGAALASWLTLRRERAARREVERKELRLKAGPRLTETQRLLEGLEWNPPADLWDESEWAVWERFEDIRWDLAELGHVHPDQVVRDTAKDLHDTLNSRGPARKLGPLAAPVALGRLDGGRRRGRAAGSGPLPPGPTRGPVGAVRPSEATWRRPGRASSPAQAHSASVRLGVQAPGPGVMHGHDPG